MSVIVTQPFLLFYDRAGEPLENGYIYIGAPGTNPETNPITVYWDASLTTTAAQPIRTLAGYPSRNGSPSQLLVNQSSYSILVKDKTGALVYSNLNVSTDEAETPETVQDVAALRALTSSMLATQVILTQNWIAGDGGGTFRYDSTDTTTADNGGTVIVDSINRRWRRQVDGETHASWFGIIPETTATTDMLSRCQALAAAIAADPIQTPRRVIFRYGEIGLSAQWQITTPIYMIGQGDYGGAVNTLVLTTGTTFKRIGATTGNACIRFYNINFGGFGVQNVTITGGSNCQYAIDIDSCTGYVFTNVVALGGTVRCWWFRGTTATNSYGLVENCRAEGLKTAQECVRFSGTIGQGNACHMVVNNFLANQGQGNTATETFTCKGITFGGSDNVRLTQVFCYVLDTNPSPNPPYSIAFDFTENPPFPANNSIYGLEAVGGIEPIAGRGSFSYCPLQVYGWMLDNTYANRRTYNQDAESNALVVIHQDHGIISGSPSFYAHRNGVDQTGIADRTPTKIAFNAVDWNIGGFFSTTNYNWISPGGKYRIDASALVSAGVADGAVCQLILYVNNTPLRFGAPMRATAANEGKVALSVVLDTIGGAAYDMRMDIETGTTATIEGDKIQTWFSAVPVIG